MIQIRTQIFQIFIVHYVRESICKCGLADIKCISETFFGVYFKFQKSYVTFQKLLMTTAYCIHSLTLCNSTHPCHMQSSSQLNKLYNLKFKYKTEIN